MNCRDFQLFRVTELLHGRVQASQDGRPENGTPKTARRGDVKNTRRPRDRLLRPRSVPSPCGPSCRPWKSSHYILHNRAPRIPSDRELSGGPSHSTGASPIAKQLNDGPDERQLIVRHQHLPAGGDLEPLTPVGRGDHRQAHGQSFQDL